MSHNNTHKTTTKIAGFSPISKNENSLQALDHISAKFIPQPTFKQVVTSTCAAIKKFRNDIRWSHFWSNNSNFTTITDTGMGTNLRGTTSTAMKADEKTEFFLKIIETALLKNIKGNWDEITFNNLKWKESENQILVKSYLKALRNSPNTVAIATDKTNRFIELSVEQYKIIASEELTKNCKIISREEVVNLYAECNDFLKTLKISKNESKYLTEALRSKHVPEIKLNIKDHKKIRDTGNYPSRLIIPCSCFCSCFSKIGYLSLKGIFEKNQVTFKHLIKDTKSAKIEIDELSLTGVPLAKIFLIDVVEMYPSINWELILRAVDYFSNNFDSNDQLKIKEALRVLKFGMERVVCKFGTELYRYVGKTEGIVALTQGAYESAWISDMVISYIFEMNKGLINEIAQYGKIYRDDGLFFSLPGKSFRDIENWFERFQDSVSLITNNAIKFTLELGGMDGFEANFLDLKIRILDSKIITEVFTKPNQQIKYLNADSCHPKWQIRNIVESTINRLDRLTTSSQRMKSTKILDYYDKHELAIKKAGLEKSLPKFKRVEVLNKKFGSTTFHEKLLPELKELPKSPREILEENPLEQNLPASPRINRPKKRKIFFCIKFIPMNLLHEPIFSIIKKTLKLLDIRLEVSMGYSRFTNFGQSLFSDVCRKVIGNFKDKNLESAVCNCMGGRCILPNECGMKNLIYSLDCRFCESTGVEMSYVGSTARTVKKRFSEHLSDVRKDIKHGTKTDSFSCHVKQHFKDLEDASMKRMRDFIRCRVVKKVDSLNRAGTDACELCSEERFYLIRQRMLGLDFMNKKDEFYFSCRHKKEFSRFVSVGDKLNSIDENCGQVDGLEKIDPGGDGI